MIEKRTKRREIALESLPAWSRCTAAQKIVIDFFCAGWRSGRWVETKARISNKERRRRPCGFCKTMWWA